jgi:hypothetical protein
MKRFNFCFYLFLIMCLIFGKNLFKYIMSTLNLCNVTSKFHIFAMFIWYINNTSCEHVGILRFNILVVPIEYKVATCFSHVK